ncbi:MAG: methylmalonyl-CoA epimerase [Nitrososphaerota archaeon]|nr:methylmalonyl-CoA epimerase [Nitrososphaerota archaeon]MDG6939963.1 methylmalonyl-CoA epimerase [Nitrososphaerota archaeon]
MAVRSLEEAVRFYTDVLGCRVAWTEEVPQEGVRIAMLRVGGGYVELMEPLSSDTPVARFLAKRGEGVHHVALAVDDAEAATRELAARSVETVYPRAREIKGSRVVNFIHPRSAHGALVEIIQRLGPSALPEAHDYPRDERDGVGEEDGADRAVEGGQDRPQLAEDQRRRHVGDAQPHVSRHQ